MNVTDQLLETLKWFCSAADLTLDDLVGHLRARFQYPEQWEMFRYALRVNEPIQIDAERELVALVKKLPECSRNLRSWSTVPGRNIDWSQTRLAQMTGRRGEFCSLVRIPTPDIQLRQALAGLAFRWLRVLNVVPDSLTLDRENRIRQLEEVEAIGPGQQSPWSLVIARRLNRIDRKAANAIESAMHLWEGEGNRGKALAVQFGQWLETDHARSIQALNEDSLFEWLVALSITRVAVNHQSAPWKLVPTLATAKDGGYGDIWLKRGEFKLRIAKGKPRGHDQELRSLIKPDIVTDAQLQAGLEPRGFQPDVVLTFFHENRRKTCITFLADAKRNHENDGRGYISPSIQKAAVYVHAFESHLFNPKCTLFFWKGVQKVLGIEVGIGPLNQPDVIAGKLNIDNEKIPDILCFDRRMMEESNGILAAWLDLLASRAEEALNMKTAECP